MIRIHFPLEAGVLGIVGKKYGQMLCLGDYFEDM